MEEEEKTASSFFTLFRNKISSVISYTSFHIFQKTTTFKYLIAKQIYNDFYAIP
jgi:hypothetical protein